MKTLRAVPGIVAEDFSLSTEDEEASEFEDILVYIANSVPARTM